MASLAACAAPAPPAPTSGTVQDTAELPGRCYARTAPQTITTIATEQVMVLPETVSPDGSITSPPVFRNEDRPVTRVVDEGMNFETLCPDELTPERVATLQRALKARLAYTGPISGAYDADTQAAVQAFQQPQGFDSPQIARTIALQLGIVASDSAPQFIGPPQ